MSNYGSTGDNLMAKSMGDPNYDSGYRTDEELWRQYMSGGGAKGEGKWTRHMDELDRIHGQQLRAAEAYYGGAGAPSVIQAAQGRGQALQAAAAAAGQGGIGGREAIYGTGQGSYQAGAQGAGEGMQSRLQAAEAYMSAQSDRAIYDQAIAAAYQRRDAAARARDQAIEQARAGGEWREQAAAMGAAGAATGAAASGMASAKGWGNEQDQQGGSKYATEG
jgi:hypothetical protein